jgi:hypothetical protein
VKFNTTAKTVFKVDLFFFSWYGSWILHEDNIMVFHTISVVKFLAGKTRCAHYMLPHATFSFPKTGVFPQ